MACKSSLLRILLSPRSLLSGLLFRNWPHFGSATETKIPWLGLASSLIETTHNVSMYTWPSKRILNVSEDRYIATVGIAGSSWPSIFHRGAKFHTEEHDSPDLIRSISHLRGMHLNQTPTMWHTYLQFLTIAEYVTLNRPAKTRKHVYASQLEISHGICYGDLRITT